MRLTPPTEPSLFDAATIADACAAADFVRYSRCCGARRTRPRGTAGNRLPSRRPAAGARSLSRSAGHVRRQCDGHRARAGSAARARGRARSVDRHERQVLREPAKGRALSRRRSARRPRSLQREQGVRELVVGATASPSRRAPRSRSATCARGQCRSAAATGRPTGSCPIAFALSLSAHALKLRNPDAVRPWLHVLEPLAGYLEVAQRLLGPNSARYATAFNFGPHAANDAKVLWVAQTVAGLWGGDACVEIVGGTSLPEAAMLRLDFDQGKPDARLEAAMESH